MRLIHWLFVISAALFISGIGFIVTGARVARQAPAVDAPALTPVATVKQIMAGIVQPSADVLFGAVGTIVSADGVVDIAPKNDEEWAKVGASVTALAEAANLLMMEGRAVDRGDWVTMSQALATSAVTTLKAVDAKDPDLLLMYGSDVNETCDACHQRYQRQ